MKNAHRTELEKELDRARKTNSNTENADIEEIRRQHEYVFYSTAAVSVGKDHFLHELVQNSVHKL